MTTLQILWPTPSGLDLAAFDQVTEARTPLEVVLDGTRMIGYLGGAHILGRGVLLSIELDTAPARIPSTRFEG